MSFFIYIKMWYNVFMKKKRVKKSVIVIPLLILIAISSFFISKTYIFKSNVSLSVNASAEFPKPDYSASLIMVGDSLIHDGVYLDAKKSDGSYDFKPMLDDLKPIIKRYDLAYYNQETVLGGTELGLSGYPRFNSPYEVGDAFIDAGFNLVSLATNHTMDMGEKGVLNSVAYWKKHPEVYTAGQYSSFEERDTPVIKEVNGIKYTFLSYTVWTNGLVPASGKEYLDSIYSDELAKKQIEAVKGKADVILVAMHWGTEYSLDIDAKQKRIAQYLSDLGVNIIIGAHPHVVEPIGYVGNTLVIYSLGNIISAQIGDERLTGIMVAVKIHKTITDGKTTITIDPPHCELTYTWHNALFKNFNVYPYLKLNTSIFSQYQSYQTKYSGIVSSISDKVKFTDLSTDDYGNN